MRSQYMIQFVRLQQNKVHLNSGQLPKIKGKSGFGQNVAFLPLI